MIETPSKPRGLVLNVLWDVTRRGLETGVRGSLTSGAFFLSSFPFIFFQGIYQLSTHDNGYLLLHPEGAWRELVDALALATLDVSKSMARRADSARALFAIMRKAAIEQLVVYDPHTVRTLAEAGRRRQRPAECVVCLCACAYCITVPSILT